MDCCAFCTSTSYQLRPFFEAMKQKYPSTWYRDLFHSSIPIQGRTIEAFFFGYGACVFWGATREVGINLLNDFREFEPQHLDELEEDVFTYIYGDTLKIVEDEIILPNRDILTKLATSYGIAQSVKLSSFEVAIQKTFNSTKHLPEDLALHGRIPLSKKEMRKKMGELFIERNSINLHADVLDTPEFFWEYPELESYYTTTANYLDLETRVEVLNQRLDVIHELFQMLGTELNNQHSSRLEWTIIMLIFIELILGFSRDVFRII